jgi:hypothetical protein
MEVEPPRPDVRQTVRELTQHLADISKVCSALEETEARDGQSAWWQSWSALARREAELAVTRATDEVAPLDPLAAHAALMALRKIQLAYPFIFGLEGLTI